MPAKNKKKPSIQFYLLDINYRVVDDEAVILLYGRTIDGKQVCIYDDRFDPYFYVIPKDGEESAVAEKLKKIEVEKKGFIAKVTGTEQIKKRFLGKDVNAVKVFVNIPKAVPAVKDVIKEWDIINSINEYDILFTRRYLIDNGFTPTTLLEITGEPIEFKSKVPVIKAESIKQLEEDSIKKPRILAFDIETYNPLGKEVVPEENPIIMIGLYGEDFRKVVTWKHFKTKEDYIEFVNSEADLLERFKEIVEQYKPDILTGYFSDGFDFPYIKVRAEKYKIKTDFSLDFSELKIGKTRVVQANLTGIVHVDIFKFVRKVISRALETDSYSLDAIAQELLGEKKVEVDIENLAEEWDKEKGNLEVFCKYNLHDAQLTYNILIKLLPNLLELVKIVGMPLFDINRMGFSQLVEWYLLRQAKNFNEIAPNKPGYHETAERRSQTYAGGFVYEPKPGLYKDIVIFDFRSLYPTIISSHNISPGTLNCSCCEGSADKVPLDEKNYWFCTKKKGFMPTIIEEIITRRMRIKEMIKEKKPEGKESDLLDARAEALKLLANSFYGYLGFFAARWYSIESADSTTAWARHYIQKVIDSAGKDGFNVIYGDTDSVFFTLDGKSQKDAVAFAAKINSELPGLMELEYEGFYPSGIFVGAKLGPYGAKKKYALLSEHNTVKIKGFETVRRNWSFIAKDVQKEVLDIILKEDNPEKAFKHVKDVIQQLRENKVPVDKVVIFTQLQKNLDEYEAIGPHVAAAQKMEQKGIAVGPGSLIKFIVVKGEGRIRDKVKLVEDTKQEEYDPEYYINNQIIPSVDKIFAVLGYDKKDLSDKGDQKKLGAFFG